MMLKDMTQQLIDQAGFSQQRLADEIKKAGVKCSQPTIWRILNNPGFDPLYSVGAEIKRLYSERFGEYQRRPKNKRLRINGA